MEEHQLENLVRPVVEEAAKWGDIPVIAAGGIWDKNDIEEMLGLGAAGVQMGTRFIGTYECDAHANFKKVLLDAKEEDIHLMKSPVGYPARGVRTHLTELIETRTGPAIKCISNCVAPCERGVEAKEVGFCIADRLSDAYEGNTELGLFFSGTNGYRIDEIVSVAELMRKLTEGE
jgi:nitronate monooxygenase